MPTATEGLMKTSLAQVGYDGADVGCSNWSALIEFDVLPNGLPKVEIPVQGIQVGAGDLPYAANLPEIYLGPGGYCGQGTPEAILNFRITVSGLDANGATIQVATEARIAHEGTDRNHLPWKDYCVVVPLPPPPNPRQGSAPSLWFNFTVGTVC